ncbi:MAG: FAD-dependent oxidoreductase, partial [Alphaproteobacteria bacterium]|nr:FAD-dependent oxidoreductase [Alphaproteobacteria bacterium]
MTAIGPAQDRDVIGAVMVVGGGIAGMQASLDLADAGYKVYLVEEKSAIGGHMAQLDKTFPTNDCAMCTISPRLVEVGRHLNIEILTESEVMNLVGAAGRFTATVRARPRYVDKASCNGCGECAEVCPERFPSRFDEGLSEQPAAHRLYPQATPDAYAIEKRGIAPCRDACPAGQRAQGYISLIRDGRIDDAYRTIVEDNPFPAVCGRICDHRCEIACSRTKVDEPVNIRGLKRFVTDTVYARPRIAPEPVPRRREERVAIIGAGPCGLTAAQDLCRAGYGVTVFEALPVAGGMLRVGVPEFRLPGSIIDREVQDILDLGVELRLNAPVARLDDLFDDGFKAVLIAVGAHEGVRLPIPGNDLDGVLINTRFLRDVRLAERGGPNAPDPRADIAGRRVLVVGGGDVAVDVARTAVRLGASDVRMAVRGSTGRMPANDEQIAWARSEGIAMHVGLNFLRVVDDGAGRVAGLECQRVARFDMGNDGRMVAQVEPDSVHLLAADTIVFSVGQRVGLGFIPEDAGVKVTSGWTIAVDPETCATDRPGVFAAGDSISGTAFVIEAVASGHRCAQAIQRYLRGEAMEAGPAPEPPVAELTQAELDARVLKGELAIAPRLRQPGIADTERQGSFVEVEGGYTRFDAMAEAARCLSCGICSECLMCSDVCGLDAIDHEMAETTRRLDIGAVILALGYRPYRAELSEEFGFGRHANVITSLQFERLLSASGPTNGQVTRRSDGQTPRKVAFLQCVGSRDQSHDYCSSVCCMYAAKQATRLVEQAPGIEVRVFMMDTRAFSKGYEGYYRKARETHGIRYVRCRISSLKENPTTGGLIVNYVDRGAPPADHAAADPAAPAIVAEEFDMVVLSVGMEIGESARVLGERFDVALDEHGFCRTMPFDPLQTTRPGVFAAGTFREPKDISESLLDASGAAARAAALLIRARGTLAREADYPPERDVEADDARTAVFVCHCGTNIGGYLDVPGVAEYAKALPGVIHAEDTLYACARDGIARITERMGELGANRLVVAACTPITHGPLFQDSIREAGLNPYLFEMANIRNQCSWVHAQQREAATEKAKDLVRMSAARAARLRPLETAEMAIVKAALVVGGGAAGMTAALALADQGFPVHLVERDDRLGGNLRHLHFGLDGPDPERDPQTFLAELVEAVGSHPLVTLHLATELTATGGFLGNFSSVLERVRPPPCAEAPGADAGDRIEVAHGVTVLATGGVEYRGDEYGYGTSSRIVTQQQFEALLAEHDRGPGEALPKSVVMIQCVGPAEKYCARICCTTALKNALVLKGLDPAARITVLYRDMRVYGFKERLYTAARDNGVILMRYEEARKPTVRVAVPSDAGPPGAGPCDERSAGGDGGGIEVRVWEEILGREMVLRPDLLVLSTPVVPAPAAQDLSNQLKVPVDMEGFFLEAHVKLRPVDFLSEGIFMAGMAHYPKL